MKPFKIAAVLMLFHGAAMELSGSLFLLPLLFSDVPSDYAPSFVVSYLNENLPLMLAAGLIFGILRVAGAAGLLKNRMWGFALSVINCALSLALCFLMLPAGILDALLAGAALVLLLIGYYGKKTIK